jgi:hypothetical protein
MQVKPKIGTSGIYLLGFLVAAFNFSNHFFGGLTALICAIGLLLLFLYFRWPKVLHLNPDSVIFEYFSGKTIILEYNSIQRVNSKGIFKWRVIFKAGDWTDILNFSLISKKDKHLILNNYCAYYESRINPKSR